MTTFRSHEFNSQKKNTFEGRKTQNRLLIVTSACPLKAQISQGLGPLFQIELLRTGRSAVDRRGFVDCLEVHETLETLKQ